MENQLNLIGIVFTIVIYSSFFVIFQLVLIFQQRILIDLVPSENRNALYSLVPTISTLISIPAMHISSVIITNQGIQYVVLFNGLFGFLAGIF